MNNDDKDDGDDDDDDDDDDQGRIQDSRAPQLPISAGPFLPLPSSPLVTTNKSATHPSLSPPLLIL